VLLDDGAGRRREAPMSFRELTMTDVREVLRRWQAGQSTRAIARESGTDRKTVVRYVGAAESCGLNKQSELTDGVVAEVAQRVQARPLTPPSDARKTLYAHRERIEAWLRAERPLRLVRIHELLARDASTSATRRCAGSRTTSSAGASARPPSGSTIRLPATRRRSTSA
jgi:hypothetical protein